MRVRLSLCFVVIGLLSSGLGACTLRTFPPEDFAIPPGSASFSALYNEYLVGCAQCHAPNAAGRTPTIEQTLDFSSRTSAYTTLTSGAASGLTGASAVCNGVPFVVAGSASASLGWVVVADASHRATFASGPCSNDGDAASDAVVTDEAAKTTLAMPEDFVSNYATWIVLNALDD